MKRRQGFTIVELLVAMALIIFIMAILSNAFIQATNTFRNLKAVGDMAERLRAATQSLQRDLADDHFEGKKRLSDPNFWLNGPPSQGYFRIWQGSASTIVTEGLDTSGIGSYRSIDHALAFTIRRRGDQLSDFLSAGGGMAALSLTPTGVSPYFFGPAEARYQTNAAYNYQWGEVAWFLQPQIDPQTGVQDVAVDQTGLLTPTPLYTLFRRQRLLVPDNTAIPGPVPATQMSQFLETSCWNNGGNIYFNGPIDTTVPARRFGMLRASPAGIPNVPGYPTSMNPYPNVGYPSISQQLTALGQSNPALNGSDIQLTDVISFDVRILTPRVTNGIDPFVTLWQAPFTTLSTSGGINNGNPAFFPMLNTGPMVFDTWSNLEDGLANYSTWNLPGIPGLPNSSPNPHHSIPLWNGTSGPLIQAIQISIRIWDAKTNQSRQVTVVQAM
jgi:type II secretory pathway pseudopilin PulG